MALIKCPDCGREVSDAAPTCPGCGRPMNASSTVGTSARPAVIERTSKSYKGAMLVGALMVIVGVIWIISAPAGTTMPIILAVLGIAVFIGARIQAWWDNG